MIDIPIYTYIIGYIYIYYISTNIMLDRLQ